MPMIGPGCALLGHIFLDRGNHQAAVEQLQQVKDRLLPGTSILFFPRAPAAAAASYRPSSWGFPHGQDIDLPILPITLKGADRILPPDNIQLRPGTATMIIHPRSRLRRCGPMSRKRCATGPARSLPRAGLTADG